MNVLDQGHLFEIDNLDAIDSRQMLRFVKRVGDNFPFNQPPSCAGTNCQEVLRVLLSRVTYLQRQKWCLENVAIAMFLWMTLWLFEFRAARRHRRLPPFRVVNVDTCKGCGHVGCNCNAAGGAK